MDLSAFPSLSQFPRNVNGPMLRKSSVGEEFDLHANICNLGSGFLATDYMNFVLNPGTQGQNTRPNRLSNILVYRSPV